MAPSKHGDTVTLRQSGIVLGSLLRDLRDAADYSVTPWPPGAAAGLDLPSSPATAEAANRTAAH